MYSTSHSLCLGILYDQRGKEYSYNHDLNKLKKIKKNDSTATNHGIPMDTNIIIKKTSTYWKERFPTSSFS